MEANKITKEDILFIKHLWIIEYFFMNFYFMNQSLPAYLEAKRIMDENYNMPITEPQEIREFINDVTQNYSKSLKTEIKTILYAVFTLINVGLYNGQGVDINAASFDTFTYYSNHLKRFLPPFVSNNSNYCQQILYYAAVILENHPRNRYLRSGEPGQMTRVRMEHVQTICNS